MKIDLREIPALWINLQEHETNKQQITSLLNGLGFKNHKRTPGIRVSGFGLVNYQQKVDHFMGVGLAQLNALRQIRGSVPALILEDDIDITDSYKPILDIPDGTDAVYLGISVAGNAYGYNLKNGYARIFNVLTTHAILYITDRIIEDVYQTTKTELFDNHVPFDVPLSRIQHKYNVITPIDPYFYQSDNKESQNKWEYLTKNRLKIYG